MGDDRWARAPTTQRPLVVVAIFALLVVDQVAYSWHYNSLTDRAEVYPETPGIKFLKDDPSLFRVASMPQFLLNGMSPFDIEDVHFSHRDSNCTFDTMLSEFHLHTEALDPTGKKARLHSSEVNALFAELVGA